MAELVDDLEAIGHGVLTARIGATCEQWHLEERFAPSLFALADRTGDPQLRQAAEATAEAVKHLDAARQELRTTNALIEKSVSTDPKPAEEC